ncbi:MAG: large conductance mechanosensitive channel protein MscL [Actinomycetota bacterium]|nr:large conductance mechanosensitive channel protein MscL [Actinomycetota bacterium]
MAVAKEFKDFILRGNVVDLAVGIMIGAAFNGVVQGFVKDLITPLVGIVGSFNFAGLHFTVNKSVFLIGDFLNVVVSFLILALVVFFFVVKPVNHLMTMRKKPEAPAPATTKTCPYCMTAIALEATRCPACTSQLTPAA